MRREAADVYEKRGVRDGRVLGAMRTLRREGFLVDAAPRPETPAPGMEGPSTPPPDLLAQMVAALELAPDAKVLEVGTGGGYTAALLGRLCREVHTVERVRGLAVAAQQNLARQGIGNVQVYHGNGFNGLRQKAPFDAILVSASVPAVPEALLRQLAAGGRLVAPLEPHAEVQTLVRIRRKGLEEFEREDLGPIRFVALLGDILCDMGTIPRDVLEQAARDAAESGRRLGDELLAAEAIAEPDLYVALARQRGFTPGHLESLLALMHATLLEQVPKGYIARHHVLPVCLEGTVLTVATCDPDVDAWELGRVFKAQTVEVHLVCPADFRKLAEALRVETSLECPGEPSAAAESPAVEALPAGGQARAVAVLDRILRDAAAERASDIHFECYDEKVRVRFRVDGALRDQPRHALAAGDLQGVVTVAKQACGLDLHEHRVPQAGRLRRPIGTELYDLRIQTQPALQAEHLSIRVLPGPARPLGLEALGFSAGLADRWRRLLRSPQGVLLVVGPTGAGKTTTLYAGLQLLARDRARKVVTVEDPVEHALAGVQQTEVASDAGFAPALRALLRQDPDVVFLSEIPDAETGREVIRASQAGRLVLSTVHCGDSLDAVQRLCDLGQHPHAVASELVGVLSQRLARRICERCRAQVEPDREIVAELYPTGVPEGFTAFRGAGCEECRGTGTRGRVAVVELLTVGADLRRAIGRGADPDEIRSIAGKAGLATLRDSALRLVQSGAVALEELVRILPVQGG